MRLLDLITPATLKKLDLMSKSNSRRVTACWVSLMDVSHPPTQYPPHCWVNGDFGRCRGHSDMNISSQHPQPRNRCFCRTRYWKRPCGYDHPPVCQLRRCFHTGYGSYYYWVEPL